MEYIYITSGTEHYLRQILAEHPGEGIMLLQNYEHSILLHETSGASVFKEENTYRKLQSSGKMKGYGFVTLEYIMMQRDEEVPIFLQNYEQMVRQLHETPGLQCVQLGQSLTQNKFLVLAFWDSEMYYQAFKATPYHARIVAMMEKNNTQIGFSHIDTYHFPEFDHDAR
ncbi:antibiotic biosynthesis monooxygenase family protein [Listeria kieliensis]|uniref:Antibiotic biosynthesis monooxygenase n=1 Tax=Listeria kieliensis TaxID=1621700 RepID=A0A3D8TST5_9LIST|nr:antibiotic biosynthesis monooxygenase [Listeria kieliensis]RDX00836.1 antibiotic biosynthesis monooxygenase [Listeria kieliensis]